MKSRTPVLAQPDIFIVTKISVPVPRAGRVNRPRLLERLESGRQQGNRLTLVSAPAGYGKTTLLADWIAQRALPAAWLSLDAADNDVAHFLNYLIAALRRQQPDCCFAAATLLQSPRPRIEAVLASLVNDLAAIPAPLLIVLDDYHFIHKDAVHSALDFLLDHLPTSVHLVIATRADPPLSLARLRARNQLTELRMNDLCFSIEEASEFLTCAAGLQLLPRTISALEARTEGWIAGLQMAAASLKGREDVESFVNLFTGSNRYVLDYLLEEVLQREPAGIQTFLLQTSILERLCGPLCEAVSGNTHSQAILEELDRDNLFIVPLDDHREWYRYHHLFSDLLQKRLSQATGLDIPGLHLRASEWYERRGEMNDAIHHAFAAGDYPRAADLIEQIAESVFVRSEVATLLSWLAQLPEEITQRRPLLSVYAAYAMMMNGQPIETAEARIANLKEGRELAENLVKPLRAFIAFYRGEMHRASVMAAEALDSLPESAFFLRGLAALMQANFSFFDQATPENLQTLETVARQSLQMGNRFTAVTAFFNLAENYIKTGRLHQAYQLHQQILDYTSDSQGRPIPIAGRILARMGELEREWNHLDRAEVLLDQGILTGNQWSHIGSLPAYLTRAILFCEKGDISSAQASIDQAAQIAREFNLTSLDDISVEMFQARLWIFQGNLEAASQWAARRKVGQEIEVSSSTDEELFILARMRKYEVGVTARLWLAQGQPEKVIQILTPWLPKVKQLDRPGLQIEMQLLLGLAYQALGQKQAALAAAENALTLAQPEGYMRLFLDEGEPARALLKTAGQTIKNPAVTAYVARLLASFPSESAAPAGEAQTHLVEPLSERELEVLRLLQSSLTAEEIARELFVSVYTVRSHVKSIYAKLGAHNRTGAVEKARLLKLV